MRRLIFFAVATTLAISARSKVESVAEEWVTLQPAGPRGTGAAR